MVKSGGAPSFENRKREREKRTEEKKKVIITFRRARIDD